MGESATLYHCDNDNIDFTGGAEAENIAILTGKPLESLDEGEDYGEGFCPNCGKKAEEVGVHEWNDPATEE